MNKKIDPAANTVISKATILVAIDEAKNAHRRWVNNVIAMVSKHSGKKIKDDGKVGRTHKDCEFGKWMDAHGVNLRKLKSLAPVIEGINTEHKRLHQAYKDMYVIFYVNPLNRSMKYKAWTKEQNIVHTNEKMDLEDKLAGLKEISVELIDKLDELKKAVNSVEYNDLKENFSRSSF